MNEKEISEIRRRFRPDKSNITHVRGCYVNERQEIVAAFDQSLALLPQEESENLLAVLRRTLAGTQGKNLIDMPFSTAQVVDSDEHRLLMALRDSALNDEDAINAFYEKVIGAYRPEGTYLILLAYDTYDVPYRSKDGMRQDDASSETYSYVLCSICPVKLSKAGLCYNTQTNNIEDRLRDWLVEMPDVGFLFPAFNERNTDIHSLLYYSKNADEFQNEFIEQMLGCRIPLPAKGQKNSFNTIIEDTLQEDCSFEAVRNIHDKLTEMMEEKKEEPEPFTLDKAEVKQLLAVNGANPEHLEHFERQYDEYIGEKEEILASNVTNTRKFEVKTPNITIQVNPERTDLLETRMIDGKTYLLIEITDSVEVNGINVRTVERKKDSEN